VTEEPELPVSGHNIRKAALRLFSHKELAQTAAPPSHQSLPHDSETPRSVWPAAAQDALEGVRELMAERLYHGALSKYAPGRQG
jgi:hypothetical protein